MSDSIETGRCVPSALLALKIAGYFGRKFEEVFEIEWEDNDIRI